MTGKQTKRPFVLAAVMLGMFMAAVEATIVATAMPTIVADLGGFSLFSWVFSAYLLMQVVMVPIYGKLSDIYGRKLIFSIGVTIFLIGSFLCGLAPSIEFLIIARLIQGLGAGAVQPVATTIVGDIYTKEERAKIQGYLASVWGISSVLGPVLGGLFVAFTHWKWIFWVNIPFGLIAMAGIIVFLKEDVDQEKRKIDYLGSGFLLITVSALMVVFIQGGVQWNWTSPQIISLMCIAALSLIAFLWQEKRAEDPVMSLSIWQHRLIALANIASLTLGAMLIGVSSFLPTYVQIVLNQPAIIAGFTLTMISVGWPISSTLAGRWIIPLGSRKTALIGGVSLMIGATMFLTLSIVQHPVWAGAGSFFLGAGMGFSTTTFIVSIQSSVSWRMRGVATASNMFMRLLGSALGVALLGGILNSRMQQFLMEQGDELTIEPSIDVVNMLLDPVGREQFSAEESQLIQEGITHSLNSVYIGVFILAFISFLLIFSLPKSDMQNSSVNK
ncbi:MDR family MFS transporter [Evansella sp. AB-P1]|uniref:MDR family MFS transporter n=1 Tax=Evansella sp. AB-P1 TaxID=3037653 RepID=UPI00241D920E|nr:MDR family MFS transporter [Evansella sp. AB-P1]MDG5786488.1 MDR family MFS transporter [Evansella sp. AB-P1]